MGKLWIVGLGSVRELIWIRAAESACGLRRANEAVSSDTAIVGAACHARTRSLSVRRRVLRQTLIALFAFAAGALADEARPLPLNKSNILRSGGSYFVEGRQEIPWAQELSVQKKTRIVGRGAGATLVVGGALQVRGVRGQEVIFENFVIEVSERCQRVHLDNVTLRGCSIRTAKGKTCEARVHIETCDFEATPIDLLLSKGKVTILNSRIVSLVRLVAVPAKGKTKSAVHALFNTSNLDREVEVTGVNDFVLRACALSGQKIELKNCEKLTFDANVCKAPSVVFEQSRPGRFKKTKIQKSDFINCKLVLKAPRDGKKKDKISCDKCFFGGRTKKADILKHDIFDGNTNEASGAYIWFKKINKRALDLGGRMLSVQGQR